MDSERKSVRSNLQVYEREFVRNYVLGCFKQTCYVMLKKGTIYIYDSKRCCLNQPQHPKLFFNLQTTKIIRNGNYLMLEDMFNKMKIWSVVEEDVSMLEECANFNRNNLQIQKIFPKKFQELEIRINQKIRFERLQD